MIDMALPEDQETLAAIGKIALRHGQLDYHLKMTVKDLASVTIHEAIDGTARQGSRELRERVRKLARSRFGEGQVLLKLEALLDRSRRATEKRNKMLHSLWARELDGHPVMRDEGHEFSAIPTVAELETVADDLAQIAIDIRTARLEGFLHKALAN